MGFFGAAYEWGREGQKVAPLPKICHTYLSMMKLGTVIPYLKKIKKNVVPLTSAIFHRKSANFAISRNTCIDCILMENFCDA